MSFNWVPIHERTRSRGRAITPDTGKYLCATAVQYKSNHNSIGVAFTFSEELMRELRWVIGDRVEIVVTEGLVGIQRVTGDSGLKLCPSTTGRGFNKRLAGKTVRAKMQACLPEHVAKKIVNGKPRITKDPIIDGSVVVLGETL